MTRGRARTSIRPKPASRPSSRTAQRALSTSTTANVSPYQTLGLATTQQVRQINALVPGVDVSGFDFALSSDDIRHAMNEHGDAAETRQTQVPIHADDFAEMPRLLNGAWGTLKPVTMYSTRREGFQITATVGAQRYTSVWEIRTGRKMLVLKSLWKYVP